VFTDDAYIDYRSAGGIDGPRDVVAAFLEEAFAGIAWAQHYITNVEIELDRDVARVNAMFYNPMQFSGFDEPSSCGGRYLHDLTRTPEGWKSARLVEENRWFLNSPFDS
jgi:hypothetical protein